MPFELKRKLEYSDLLAVPNDGKGYQLVRGDLFVTPSPSPTHQRVSKRLMVLLMQYFEGRSLGEVFCAPIDLILTEQDVFVPDLVVVPEEAHVTRRGIERPPLLVVEILSPATRNLDLTVKALRYAELGVENYWIVDPDARRIECHRLTDGVYLSKIEVGAKGTLHPAWWPGLEIDLTSLWR